MSTLILTLFGVGFLVMFLGFGAGKRKIGILGVGMFAGSLLLGAFNPNALEQDAQSVEPEDSGAPIKAPETSLPKAAVQATQPAPHKAVSVSHLMNEYDDLRERVGIIVTHMQTGADTADEYRLFGSQWYDDERAFQAEVNTLTPRSSEPSIKGDLLTSDSFLYNAVVDGMVSCDTETARRELEVADYFYAAVKKEAKTGLPADTSNPPEVEAATNKCPH